MVPVATLAPSAATVQIREVASAQDISTIAGTLTRAFFADPVFAWTFPDPERRWRNLPGLFELYAQAYARHGETYMTSAATGAALWLPPGRELFAEGEEEAFGGQIEEGAGVDAGRLFELMGLLDEHHPAGSLWTLQMLAVEPQWQGQGIGSALMAPVLERCDAEQVPVYLEATSEPGAALYARHGFETVEEIRLRDGPPLFAMWREPRA
jgi:GNAT superfamily N-acetyltransferase